MTRYLRWSDEDLALAFRGGDSDAGEALLQRYSRFVYALAGRFGRGGDDAEDIYIEVWIKLQEQIRHYEHRSGFRAYLRSLVRSVIIDYIRRGAAREEVLSIDAGGDGDDDPALIDTIPDSASLEAAVVDTERRDLVQRAVEDLPERFRIPLELYYRKGHSHEAIAEMLGIPKNTVTTRIHRGREQIKRWLSRRLAD